MQSLSQVIEGNERVIALSSRVLTKSEKHYCATRKEMLALVWGVQHFRAYLVGQAFTACTDHHSLKWLRSFKNPEGQVARWLETLAEYNIEIEYQPGLKHHNADALSRGPCTQCGLSDDILPPVNSCSASSTLYQTFIPSWAPREIQDFEKEDVNIYQMITWLQEKSVPLHFPKVASRALQTLWLQRKFLTLRDGILYRCWEDVPGGGKNKRLQLVLPHKMRTQVLEGLHNSRSGSHLGVMKTLQKVQYRFYWPGQ